MVVPTKGSVHYHYKLQEYGTAELAFFPSTKICACGMILLGSGSPNANKIAGQSMA